MKVADMYSNSKSVRKTFLEDSLVKKYVRWWLMAVIVILPLHSGINEILLPTNDQLLKYLRYVDELTVAVLLPIALLKLYFNREFPIYLYSILLASLLIFAFSGMTSGLINGNSFYVSVLGIMDYLQYFAVIFIYAAFFGKLDELNKLLSVLVKIALLLVAIAFLQEIRALLERYIFDSGTYDVTRWRLGIFRPTSLLKSSNIYGLYLLLVFAAYICSSKKVKFIITAILLLGILMSVSRIAYAGLILVSVAQIYRGKKSYIFILAPLLTLMAILFYFVGIGFVQGPASDRVTNPDNNIYIDQRTATKQIALKIWQDNMAFGAGPGTYGGAVSLQFESPVYKTYQLPYIVHWHLHRAGNMHQFWYQLIAEMGIVGVIAFCIMLLSLIAVLLILRIWSGSYDIGELFVGLIVISLTIIIFTLFTGLNPMPLMFTFYAIIGVAIGSQKEQLE